MEYHRVKRAFFKPEDGLSSYTPYDEIKGDPWNMFEPDTDESIGGLILEVAQYGYIDGLRERKFPLDMLMAHREEVLEALANSNQLIKIELWDDFISALQLEHRTDNAYRMVENQWKILQAAFTGVDYDYWFFQYFLNIVITWGIVENAVDLSYLRLPQRLKIEDESSVSVYYEASVARMANQDITQEQIDFIIRKTLEFYGSPPNKSNRSGLYFLGRTLFRPSIDFLYLLKKGIVFPPLDGEDTIVQYEFPEIIAWQDGMWLRNRHSDVQEVARYLEAEFGRRADLTNNYQEFMSRDVLGIVAQYDIGVADPVRQRGDKRASTSGGTPNGSRRRRE